MNLDITSPVATEKAKSVSGDSKSECIDEGILVSEDDDFSKFVADPLGLCPLGVRSIRLERLQTVTPKLCYPSSSVAGDNTSEFAVGHTSQPLTVDINDLLEKRVRSFPVGKMLVSKTSIDGYEQVVTATNEVCKHPSLSRSNEVSKECTTMSPSAVEVSELSNCKSLKSCQAIDGVPEAPAKSVSSRKIADPTIGSHKKNAPDVSKPMANVSIHFSKKAMYDESDEDQGMGIAISVTSVTNKESNTSDKSSSLESVSDDGLDQSVPDCSVAATSKENQNDSDICSTPTKAGVSECKIDIGSSERKRKGWYSMLSSTYKSRSIDYKRLFKDIPSSERLIVDYSCALQREILCHGRLYVSRDWICFYSNIFRWETTMMIRTKDVVKVTKEKTALVIPNAIQISTVDDKSYFFASFAARDKTFIILDRIRKCALEDQPMNLQELWQWVHYSYGEDLGLTDHDDDYVSLSSEEKIDFQTQIQQKLVEQSTEGLSPAESTADLDSTKSVGDLDSSVGETNPNDVMKRKLLSGFSSDISSRVNAQGQFVAVKGASPKCSNNEGTESDNEESSEGQMKEGLSTIDLCSAHEHLGINAVDEVVDVPVETLFQYIFSDSMVFQNFLNARKTFDAVLGKWPSEPDSNGFKVRNISYTLTLTSSLGPKTSPSTERQMLHPLSLPGELYLVDAEVINSKIPYGEDFYVLTRYCLSRVTTKKSRLRITSEIKYRKNVWGFVKNILEKNVTAGIIEAFTCLANVVKQECVPRKRMSRRRQVSDGRSTIVTPVVAASHGRQDVQPLTTSDVFIRILLAMMTLLMIFNIMLLFKLWSIESHVYDGHFAELSRPLNDISNGLLSIGSNIDIVKLLDEIASLLGNLKQLVVTQRRGTCDDKSCS